MQKKIIALAVAALASSAAFAQTNVQIYGIVDAGMSFDNAKSGAGTQSRVQSGQSAGSRIGFKGTEDLGNGLTAGFTLEQGFALDNGQATSHGTNGGDTAGQNTNTMAGGTLFQRQAFLSLSSKTAGTVAFGRQYTPFFAVKAKSDVFGLGMGGTMNNLASYVPGALDRLNNTVAYVSPNVAGFSGVVAYSSGQENNVNGGTTGSGEKAGKTWGALAQYENGPLWAGLAYHNAHTVGAATTTSTADLGTGAVTSATTYADNLHAKSWLLGASYDFGVVKLNAAYGAGKATNDTTGADAAKGRMYHIGLAAPFGKHTVKVGYTAGQNRLDRDEKDAKLFGLAYEYAVSKRTSAYAGYSKLVNESRVGNSINSATTNGLTGVANGNDPTSINVGIRHSF